MSRTDGSGLDHVADGEALDGLVLGGAASAVGATHRLDVAAAILVAAAIKSISYRAPLKLRIDRNPVFPFLSGNVRRSRFSMYLEMYVVCASVGVIAEMSNGILLSPRWGNLLVLLVRPLLDHFDGLFCGWLGIGLWVKGGR